MIENIVLFMAGFIVAMSAIVLFYYQGILHIDNSDPDTDKYLLDLQDLDSIPKKKFILLMVKINNDDF